MRARTPHAKAGVGISRREDGPWGGVGTCGARRAGCDNVLPARTPADPTGGRAGDAGRRARPASNVVLAVIEAHETIVECTHVAHRRARFDPATRWTPSTIGARVVGLPVSV